MNEPTKRELISTSILQGLLAAHTPSNPADREQMISLAVRMGDLLIDAVGDEAANDE